MFIRKKKNPSGIISVQVIDKSRGKYRVIKTIGSSSDKITIKELCVQAEDWLSVYVRGQDLFKQSTKEQEEVLKAQFLLSNIDNILINGTQLILDKVFRLIGFDQINDDILRHLVVARLSQPMSKSGTVEYLKSYFDEDIQLHKIYRYLDKLYNTQQEKIQQISVLHTQKILGGSIGLMFYDVTTLYFETEDSDELREKGFSKDGKHSQPQVVLGLLVSKDGYPLSYSLFNGAQFEGRTMIPLIDDFVKRFNLTDFVVVADSGLMNKSNVALLESGEYKYIIGARIKSEPEQVKQWIFSLEKEDNEFNELKKGNSRLIIGYSTKRARKDKYNREQGVRRLQNAYSSGSITKENINKRGYNKFLDISNNIKVEINNQKVRDDEKWDGLKGYITNTSLSAKEVYEQYHGLWVVEKAFRVTKGTIELRPMFHFNPRRIEAHVCVCFVAFKVYKELDRILKLKGIGLSVDKVISISKTITTIKVKLPISNTHFSKTMLITSRHKSIEMLFDDNFWDNI